MYEDILFPYDGSDGAAAVLHHASELAQWAGATLHVLYVADTTRESVVVVEDRVVDALERQGDDIVAEAAETLDSLDTRYRTDVVQGNPAPTIVEYAAQYDHDLVVMPTHARAGLSRYLIGSVTEKVVRLSPTPVLTARMNPDEQLHFPYENLLIPTDGSEAAMAAAREGLSFADALDATVHVVSAVEDDSQVLDVLDGTADANSEKAAADAVDEVAAAAAGRGLTTARHVEHGPPVEVLLDCIERENVDAVVMGTTGRRGTDRILLGSVTEKTVRSAPIPVLTVRDQGE